MTAYRGYQYINSIQYHVPSATDGLHSYTVVMKKATNGVAFACNCPDWIYRKQNSLKGCKHISTVKRVFCGDLSDLDRI